MHDDNDILLSAIEDFENSYATEKEKPLLVYMTPECFSKQMHFFAQHRDEIKMVVLDEAHKIFDRNSGFRQSYVSKFASSFL